MNELSISDRAGRRTGRLTLLGVLGEKHLGKVRNIIFVAVLALCVFSVLGYRAAVVLLPGQVTSTEASVLEGRTYVEFPWITQETVSSGEFQSGFESYIADHVPERNSVLLANARAQRELIRVASKAFGYNVYPTYYGSEYLFYDQNGAVIDEPLNKFKVSLENATKVVKRCTRLTRKFKDKNFVYYFCDRSSTSMASPAHDLCSDVADYEYFRQNFLNLFPAGFKVVDGGYTDSNEFFSDHFTTDHHWQVQGAVKAYQSICQELGKEPIEFEGYKCVYPGPFYGSSARAGLCTDGGGSWIDDVVYDRSILKVTVGGVPVPESYLDEGFGWYADDFELSDRFASGYAQWFHAPDKTTVITNDNVKSGSLLLIGDSFTNNMERFFAENYHKVYKIEPRHFNGRVSRFIKKNNIDDVVCIFNETLYDNRATRRALR